MANKIRILIIGTFVSKLRGSISRAEELQQLLSDKYDIQLSSSISNKIYRLLDIIISIVTFRGKLILVDTYSGQAFMISEIATLFGRLMGKRILLILRGGILPKFDEAQPNRIHRLFRFAHEIHTPSLFLQAYFIKRGFTIHYLPNWVNLEKFTFNRKLVHPHKILWVRAFSQIYDPILAIQTVYHLRKSFPEISLTMIGPDKGKLNDVKKEIDKYALSDNINIIGPIANTELPVFFQNHAVYLNTTKYESFGVAIVEAAACGIPIVSTEVGEIPFMWKDKDNILFASNSDEFSKSISTLLLNPEIAAKQANQAYLNAQKYDWLAVRSIWLKLLEKHA